MTEGTVSWRSVQSSYVGSEVVWDDWKQGGYEVNTRRCAAIRRVNWIKAEVRGYPTLTNMKTVNIFINKVEDNVPEKHKVPLMDVALQSKSARWWVNHRNSLRS